MKYLALALFSVFFLKVGKFTSISGENLNGLTITLPDSSSEKLTLVGLSYSKKSEGSLKSWFMPLYDKFVLKRGIFDKGYDINTYFIPMFTGLKKSAYENTLKKLKDSNRKTLFDHIVFYKGDLEPYKSDLSLDEKTIPYLFIIDPEGTIIHRTQGEFTEGKLEKIEEAIDNY